MGCRLLPGLGWTHDRACLAELQRRAAPAEQRDQCALSAPDRRTHLWSPSAIFLEHPDQHPRVGRRIELTASIVAASGASVERLRARGRSALERTLSLVMLGDLVSVYRAVLDGRDPTPVDAIEGFKQRLVEDTSGAALQFSGAGNAA